MIILKNFFITGKPASGKTSLILEIIKELNLKAGGFYTQEIREGGKRKGFKITSLTGQEGILAHLNFKSFYRVSKYKVNLKDLEEIGVKSLLQALRENKILIIDEIGKAEMYSEKFKKAVLTALNSQNKILGTIKLTPDAFTNQIKKRPDTEIIYLNQENREEVKKRVKEFLI